MAANHRTAPDPAEKGWPGGIPYIIGNEACERFSFYGMSSILVPYLTTLYIAEGVTKDLAANQASVDLHMFKASLYALPMVGAIIADKLAGKYLTIMLLSLVYCAGHAVLSVAEDSLSGIQLGLALIAIGSGGIKPCVSAHVGDQFGEGNWHLTKKVFQAFYFSINFGSFFSTLLIPWTLKEFGPSVAFGIPGVLMFIATVVFWMGRNKFVHVPPNPGGKLGGLDALASILLFVGALGGWMFGPKFNLSSTAVWILSPAALIAGFGVFLFRQSKQADDGFLAVCTSVAIRGVKETRLRMGEEAMEGMKAVFRVLSVLLFIPIFWSLFDQHHSTWLTQAGQMDRNVFGIEIIAAQTASMNPILVLLLIPMFVFGVFPWMEKRGIKITPLRRMSVGMFLTGLSFVSSALIQSRLDAGGYMHIGWQVIPYVLLTAGEVLVSATGLEFAYSQAPRRMKSTLMAFWNLMVTFGSLFTAAVLSGLASWSLTDKFWLFALSMLGFAVLFVVRVQFYTYRDYAQK